MVVSRVDQANAMLNALIPQYKNSPNIKAFYQSCGELICQDIEDQSLQIYNMCDLENSTGNILDMVGGLIGLPRMSILIPSDVWILDLTPFTGHQFGDEVYLFYELAPDDVYRDAIRAYAINQTSEGDLRSLEKTLRLIYGMTVDTDLTIEFVSTLNVNVTINVPVTIGRRSLVDIYVTPNGGKLWSQVAGCVYNFTYPS